MSKNARNNEPSDILQRIIGSSVAISKPMIGNQLSLPGLTKPDRRASVVSRTEGAGLASPGQARFASAALGHAPFNSTL
jgi:hypothetical protein